MAVITPGTANLCVVGGGKRVMLRVAVPANPYRVARAHVLPQRVWGKAVRMVCDAMSIAGPPVRFQ